MLLISFVFVYGCVPRPSEMSHDVSIAGLDFTKYTAKGFTFTPEAYTGQYESVGQFRVTVSPEIVKSLPSDDDNYKTVRAQGDKWFVEKINLTEAIDSIYALAVKMGANAIVRFKIDLVPRSDGPLLYECYEASGFAIKILNKNGL